MRSNQYPEFIDALYAVLPIYKIERYESINPDSFEMRAIEKGVRDPSAVINMMVKGSASISTIRALFSAADKSLQWLSDGLLNIVATDVSELMVINSATGGGSLETSERVLSLIKMLKAGKRVITSSRKEGIDVVSRGKVVSYSEKERNNNNNNTGSTKRSRTQKPSGDRSDDILANAFG